MSQENLSLGDQWRIFREEGMSSLQNRNKAAAEEQKRLRKLAKITERDGRIEFRKNKTDRKDRSPHRSSGTSTWNEGAAWSRIFLRSRKITGRCGSWVLPW